MDPFTLGAVGVGGAIISALVAAGPVIAPVAGAAAAAGPLATVATAVAVPAGAALAAGSAAPAALVASNPHAALGAQNAINDAINQGVANFNNTVNGLNIPGVPPLG